MILYEEDFAIVIRNMLPFLVLASETKYKSAKYITDLEEIDLDDEPTYGLEAIIATIKDEQELIKALREASRYNSKFGKKSQSNSN